MNKPVSISSFNDFLDKFDEFLFQDGSIEPTYCLEVAHYHYFEFIGGYTEQQLNNDIIENKNMFTWEETNEFYYPNTNMFSGDNSKKGIKGYNVKRIKPKCAASNEEISSCDKQEKLYDKTNQVLKNYGITDDADFETFRDDNQENDKFEMFKEEVFATVINTLIGWD